MTNQATLERWINPDLSTMDDLLEELAIQSPQADAFAGNLAKRGREIILALRGELQKVICCSSEVLEHSYLSDEIADKLALVAVIASLIPEEMGKAMNATLVAAILVRIGIRRFCESGLK